MWATILAALASPVLNSAVKAYQLKLQAGNTSENIAATLATRELLVEQREIEVEGQLKIAEVGHPWEVEKLFAYVTLVYYSKCLLWDKILYLGSTDPLKGDISVWAGVIISFYFGKRTVETALRIWQRK